MKCFIIYYVMCCVAILMLANGCANSQALPSNNTCYYKTNETGVVEDTSDFYRSEYLDFINSSQKNEAIFFYRNVNINSSKHFVRLTQVDEYFSLISKRLGAKTVLDLNKKELSMLRSTFSNLLEGDYIQYCSSADAYDSNNYFLIVIKVNNKVHFRYFSPYTSPLQLKAESKESLNKNYVLMQFLYEKSFKAKGE